MTALMNEVISYFNVVSVSNDIFVTVKFNNIINIEEVVTKILVHYLYVDDEEDINMDEDMVRSTRFLVRFLKNFIKDKDSDPLDILYKLYNIEDNVNDIVNIEEREELKKLRMITSKVLPYPLLQKLIRTISILEETVMTNVENKKTMLVLILAVIYHDLLHGTRVEVSKAEMLIAILRALVTKHLSYPNYYLPLCPSSSDVVTLLLLTLIYS